MVSAQQFRKQALSFPGTGEAPHFERSSFRIGKKIFATLDDKKGMATLRLSEVDQSVFCLANKAAIYPVPNKWGKQGWTIVVLSAVPAALLRDALSKAHGYVLEPKKKMNILGICQ